jgi:phage terminase small subunit
MEPLSREAILGRLRTANPGARADDLAMYADCFHDYAEAVANIAKNGVIVVHPRTGSPIENPYLKVKIVAMGAMKKLHRVRNVDTLWQEE